MALSPSMTARYTESRPPEVSILTTLQSGELIDNCPAHEDGMLVTDLQWSPDRTYFITASKDKTAKVCSRHV